MPLFPLLLKTNDNKFYTIVHVTYYPALFNWGVAYEKNLNFIVQNRTTRGCKKHLQDIFNDKHLFESSWMRQAGE